MMGRLPRKCGWKSEVLEKAFFQRNFYMDGGDLFTGCRKLKKMFVIEVGTNSAYDLLYYDGRERYVANELWDLWQELTQSYVKELLPANISYNYNYEGSTNYGIYFIDDCDYGGKIEYIPAEPTRDGYTFGGWYKEAECVNKWDFATDTLPAEITETNEDGEKEVKYQETKLYAKWEQVT